MLEETINFAKIAFGIPRTLAIFNIPSFVLAYFMTIFTVPSSSGGGRNRGSTNNSLSYLVYAAYFAVFALFQAVLASAYSLISLELIEEFVQQGIVDAMWEETFW